MLGHRKTGTRRRPQAAGKLRLEGKEDIVQYGDVMQFRFSV